MTVREARSSTTEAEENVHARQQQTGPQVADKACPDQSPGAIPVGGTKGVTRGVIVGQGTVGEVLVVAENDPHRRIACERLELVELPAAPYWPGDRVLAPLPGAAELGCVLGRVGLPEPERSRGRTGRRKQLCGPGDD